MFSRAPSSPLECLTLLRPGHLLGLVGKPLRSTTDRQTAVCPVTGPLHPATGQGAVRVSGWGKRPLSSPQLTSSRGRGGAGEIVGWPCSARSHLGVPKPILLPVHVDGAQKLLGSVFTINELPLWDGAGIEDPVPEEGGRGSVPGLFGQSQGREASGPTGLPRGLHRLLPAQSPWQPRPARPGPPLSCG